MRFSALLFLAALSARAADTVAILPFFNLNEAGAPGLDWIGESVAETLRETLHSAGVLVLAREERVEVYRRLSLRTGVVLTKASVIKVGQNLDAGEVIFGDFAVDGVGSNAAPPPDATLRLTIHAIDLKKLTETASFGQSGPLRDLSELEMKLAWSMAKRAQPESTPDEAAFRRDRPPVRLDAMESYIRGLLATSAEQKTRLFSQAARLDERFSQPNFQLGRMLFQKKDYRAAASSLAKTTRGDSHFEEAQFLLGICRYYENDFDAAAKLFRAVLADLPLNEVYNNLGAALSRRNDAAAVENFRKALEGDEGDPDYWFNTGYALWKNGKFKEAADRFRAVLDRSRGDQDATVLLGRCLRSDGPRADDPRSDGRERIKTTFEDSAFRQLQAELKKK